MARPREVAKRVEGRVEMVDGRVEVGFRGGEGGARRERE